MSRVYVSGAMTGMPRHNFAAFEAAAQHLRGKGHEVFSPHEMDSPEDLAALDRETAAGDPYGPAYERFLERDVELLETENLDGVVLLSGWEESHGVRRELEAAWAKGLRAWRFSPQADDGLGFEVTHPPASWAEPEKVTQIAVLQGNPKDLNAAALDKTPLDLLEPVAEEQIARALKFGADKYGVRNYIVDPIRARVYVAAIKRHVDAWLTGEDMARDSGLHHLAHVGANVHVALAAIAAGSFVDDRPGS